MHKILNKKLSQPSQKIHKTKKKEDKIKKKEIDKKIGENLVSIRKKMGLSQWDLALTLGLTRSWVANIEKGRQGLTLATLYKLCETLNIDILDILVNPNLNVNLVSNSRMLEIEISCIKRKYDNLKKSLSEVLSHLNSSKF